MSRILPGRGWTLLIVFILLLAGAFAYRWRQARRAPAVAAAQGASAGPVKKALPAGAPLPVGKPGEPVTLRRIKQPGQKDQVFVQKGGGGKSLADLPPPPGMTAPQHKAMQRDLAGGMGSMKGMIDAGMAPEKAAAITQRGLQESLNKQFQAQGGVAPRVNVTSDGKGVKVRIAKPAAGPPAGQGGSRGARK